MVFSLRAPTHPVNPANNHTSVKLLTQLTTSRWKWQKELTNYESDSASPYEDKGRVEGDVGELAQVVEGVLLRPGPDPDGQDSQSQQLNWTINKKNNRLQTLTQKMTLKPKMTYLRQQETSLVSLIRLRLFWF